MAREVFQEILKDLVRRFYDQHNNKLQLRKEYKFTEYGTGFKKDRAVEDIFFIQGREDLKLLCSKKNMF